MRTGLIAAGLVATLALTAGAAAAKGHRDRPDLAAMGMDGDGAVSLEEMTAYAQARTAERVARMFARLDADSDGVITPAEFEAGKAMRGNRPGRQGHGSSD